VSVVIPQTIAPHYVDVGSSYTDVILPPLVFSQTRILVKVPGTYFAMPSQLYFVLHASANAGNRAVVAVALDPNGNVVYQVPAVATQGPGLVNAYTFSTSISAAFGSTALNFAGPLPLLVFAPGYSFGVQVNGLDVADTADACAFTMIKSPTGPDPTGTPATLLPTPPLV